MRLTALCVCGTLLAFSSLSRIRAEEGVLLGDQGFGPCTATLRPAGACRPGEPDSACAYHISLPPLVVHLPQHFFELENIMQDLQKLKDSVDELREMCADCTAGRKCGRQSEGKLKGGKSSPDDEGDWMDESLDENDRGFRQECGKDGAKVETTDGGNDMEKKLKDGNEWETGGVVKENEGEERVTEGAEGKEALEKMPTSGGNMQTVNVTSEKTAETNPKGSVRKYQDEVLDKNKENTKAESGHKMWRGKTKKLDENSKATAFDGEKMSKNHTLNINKEQDQMEVERGIKVDPNKKKPKQMERFGLTEKDREIKTESVPRDGDGETSSSKTTEKADFLSISPTPLSAGLTSRSDSSDTKSFTSSLPSPSLLSSTLSSITDVILDPKAGYRVAGSTEPGAAGVTELHSQAKAKLPEMIATISTVGGPREQMTSDGAGLTRTTPTTTIRQSLFITSSPTYKDQSHKAPKKNISPKTKTGLKTPPLRAKPGEKQKSGIKPKAENRLKNAKNDQKPNQGPSTEGKTKFIQKQKPNKPTAAKSKPGKDTKPNQIKTPDQRTTPDVSTTEENLKNNWMHKQEVAANEPKPKKNSSTSVQRPTDQGPQAINATHSGEHPLINKSDQNLKLEKKLIHLFIPDKSDQKSVERLDSKEKLNETSESTHRVNFASNLTFVVNFPLNKSIQKIPTSNPQPEDFLELKSTPKPNQKPLNGENITPDFMPGRDIISHQPHTAPDNMNDSNKDRLQPSPEFETKTATASTEPGDETEENFLQETKSDPDLTPGQTSAPDQAPVTPDQRKKSSQDHLKTKNKPETTQQSSSEENIRETSTNKPKQTLVIEPMNKSGKNPSEDPKLNPDLTPGWTSAPDRADLTFNLKNKSSQGIPKTKHKPELIKPKSQKIETAALPKPNQKHLIHLLEKSVENPLRKSKTHPDLSPGQKVIPDQANATLDYMNKSSQGDNKPRHKPETNKEYKFVTADKSDKNPLQEFKSNPPLTPGQTSVLDQDARNPNQKNKSSEDHFKSKHKTENVQEINSNKSKTAVSKPSIKSEQTSWQDPTHNPALRPGRKPDQATPRPDMRKKSSNDSSKDKGRSENFNTSITATPKQKLLLESEDQSEDLQEPTIYPDLIPNTNPDQMNEPNREHPKTHTFQKFKFNKSETSPKVSTESWNTFQEKSLLEANTDPGLPPQQTSSMDQTTATTHQLIQSSHDHLEPTENSENIHEFMSNKSETANQKPLPEPADNSEDSLRQTKLYLHGQTSNPDQATTTPDQINTYNYEYLETQTSKEFKFTKSEAASQKPLTESWGKTEETSLQLPTPNHGFTSGHRSTLDLAAATPDQMKTSTTTYLKTEPSHETKFRKSETATQKPSTESWHKSEEGSAQEPTSNSGLEPEETPTSDLAPATTDKINKSIQDHHEAENNPENIPEFKANKSETAAKKPNQKPLPLSTDKYQERKNNSDSMYTPKKAKTPPDQRYKPSRYVPKFNKKPKSGQDPKQNDKNVKTAPKLKRIRPNAYLRTNQGQQTNPGVKSPLPGLKPTSMPEKILKAAYNKTSKLRPRHRPTIEPGVTPIQRSKQAPEPNQTKTDPPQISWAPSGSIRSSRTDMPPTSGLVKQIAEMSHPPGETEFSTNVKKTITLSPKTSPSLVTGYFPALHTHAEDVTSSPNTRIMSDLWPQTATPPSSVPMTTRPNKIHPGILQNVITSTGPGSTHPSIAPKSKAETGREEKSHLVKPVGSPRLETTSTHRPNFRTRPSTTSDPKPPPAALSTPSPRELRVKINQVPAFLNNSLIPNGRPRELPKEKQEGSQRGKEPGRAGGKLPASPAFTAIRDCSDHVLRGRTRSGVYVVTPDLRSSSFPVFCDMELDGGGWTLLQRRQDGSVSFNRTWVEYQAGFGVLDGGEFWLGNNKMHLLTRDRDMMLRVELEDFDGVTEHAQYQHFRVASERLRYRLTVGGYSGTAGDALRFSKTYDHHNRAFTTPDRDHDRYPSGNCGAYYSSGWWFDACMAANLNGRYYSGKYKGVRDGIFWGTWHNISSEYYPTNERQSFKSVRMMIRPRSFDPLS